MAIQATQPTSNAAAATSTAGNNKQITKEDFLKLLISQLQNQDPLKPLDNQEFAQQLATFNSLEQLVGVNEKLGSLSDKLLQANQFNATGLLGKQITGAGNQLSIKEGQSTSLTYKLTGEAAQVFVDIKNSQGNLVRRLQLSNQAAGSQQVSWNGKDAAGQPVPAGLYTFDINATDKQGKKVEAAGQVQGTVSGIDFSGGEPMLDVDGRRVPLSGVIAVH